MIAFYLKRNISLIKFLDGVPLPAHPEQNLRLGGRGAGGRMEVDYSCYTRTKSGSNVKWCRAVVSKVRCTERSI